MISAARHNNSQAPSSTVGDFDRFVFIVGGPRCGTTTLSGFLKTHPSISFPVVKEPHFFAQNDLRGLADEELRRRVESEYLQRFFRRDPERRIGADASVTYLYAPEQLEPILRLWPESRFIVAVRDPLAMLPSLHRRLIYVGIETIPNFADAWAAVSDRAAGRRIPRTCPDPKSLRYDEAARFGTYLERLFSVVGRERCFVSVFDDLVQNPAEQYRAMMEFAGLKPEADIDFKPRREGQSVRFHWLQRALKQPPKAMIERAAGYRLQQLTRTDGDMRRRRSAELLFSVRKRLLRWNRISAPVERPAPALQHRLRTHFGNEIDRLSKLLDRDLSHWLQPDSNLAEQEGRSARRATASSRSQPVAGPA